MKKLVLFTTLLLTMGITSACAEDDKPIDNTQLPQAAQQFIKSYFPNETVTFASVDKEVFESQYDVYLSNGTELEFDGDGQWKEVNCKTSPIPAGIVPERIVDYVATNHPNLQIVKISRDSREYEIELYPGGMELVFDSNGDFKRYDS